MRTLVSIQNEKTSLLAEATRMVNAGIKNRSQQEAYTELLRKADILNGDIAAYHTIEAHNQRTVPAPVAALVQEEQRAAAILTPEERRANRNLAYRNFLLGRPFEKRDITTGASGDDGAALVKQDFDGVFTQAQKWYGPIAQLVKVRKTEGIGIGRPQKFVLSNDTTSTMTYIPETESSSGVEADPAVSSTVPGADTVVSTVLYSFQEAEDVDNIEGFLTELAAIRTARSNEYILSLGLDNGSNTALPNSPAGGFLASVSAGVTQSSGELSAGPTLGQLNQLAASVDHAYYVNGSFMASPSVFSFLVAQVDTTGRPLYKFDDDGNLLIAGKKLWVNSTMPAYNTASSAIVTFGDYSKAYAFLDGGLSIRILKERYADQLLRAAVLYQRIGAAVLIPSAVKSLLTAAS